MNLFFDITSVTVDALPQAVFPSIYCVPFLKNSAYFLNAPRKFSDIEARNLEIL